MNHFNTSAEIGETKSVSLGRLWRLTRNELRETLRDRRTLVAMVLVPMVLYPALMLGSIQALEVQVSQLQTERYDVAVADAAQERWLRRLIDSDPALVYQASIPCVAQNVPTSSTAPSIASPTARAPSLP